MDVRVRRIRPDEGSTLKAVRLRALTDAPYAFATTVAEAKRKTDIEWAADAARWATGSTAAGFFAESDGAIVGMGGVFIDDGHGELVAMWTAPHTRRRGIGQQIIEAVARWCHEAGLTELCTGVADGNDAAALLYENAGFVDSGQSRPLGSDGTRIERRYRHGLDPR